MTSRYLVPLFILFGALLPSTRPCLAADYFVDAGKGSDTNDGATREKPWRTIAHAAGVLQPGDTCTVLPGKYDERVSITRSGKEGAPIAYRGEGKPVCQGFAVSADDIRISGFEITDAPLPSGPGIGVDRGRRCEFSGNTIHHVPGPGIMVRPNWRLPLDSDTVADCVVRNNKISYAVECGIFVAGQRHLIEGNEVSHTQCLLPGMTQTRDADGMRFFGKRHVFRGNLIHDLLHEENKPRDPHTDFFQTWASAEDILFERNFCYSRDTFGSNQIAMLETLGGRVRHLTFRNNVFIMSDPGYCPMNFCQKRQPTATAPQGQPPIEDVTVVNNAFIHLGGMGEYGIWLNGVKRAVVKNNLFYNYGSGRYSYLFIEGPVEGLEIGGNCVYKTDGKAPQGGAYPGDLWMVDPQFVDVKGFDFRPQPGSPLLHAGVPLPMVTDDFLGRPRPKEGKVTIGPFEGTGGEWKGMRP